jgi:bifunctional UDP-N-acetylglucosamine pyrophosphorylase / glucosamine-1-phosphate N-acetyltransferase
MTRGLIVPAAGTGSRLGSPLPKILHPVAGRSMLAHLASLYRPWIDCWHLVARPQDRDVIAKACRALALPAEVHVQPTPLGMLDAVLRPLDAVAREAPDTVWITWCDQVVLHPETLARLVAAQAGDPMPALTLPTCVRDDPYIHLERDERGRLQRVLHRREGDLMPAQGETDAGLFALSPGAYLTDLPRFAAEPAVVGARTGERNFLPILPWLEGRGGVTAVPCGEDETMGVNTPADLARVEQDLARR